MEAPDVTGHTPVEHMPRAALEREVRRSRETIRRLKRLSVACAERILKQSELLPKKAEKRLTPPYG